jgi:hypothetical protein
MRCHQKVYNRMQKVRWPDGAYVSVTPAIPRVGLAGVGGTYYWNPGSPEAPPVTVTGMWGHGRDVWKIPLGPLGSLNAGVTFLRNGMTSADTTGYGTTSNVSTIIPSVSVNSTIPDENYVPQPAKAKVSSIDAGISGSIGASTASTATATPRQIIDFLARHIIGPAMGPEDELPPFVRSLQSRVGTIGEAREPPIRYLGARAQNPYGDGMGDWRSSRDSNVPGSVVASGATGGLLGLLQDYVRDR